VNYKKERLERVFKECDKHLMRLQSAFKKMSPSIPLNSNSYESLSDDEVEHIDQYLFRFAKLQDAIGKKLFKALLDYFEEDIENLTFIDILNRLEKLQILEDKNDWQTLRIIRNNLAHEYDDNSEEMSSAINLIYEKKELIEKIYLKIVDYYQKKRDN